MKTSASREPSRGEVSVSTQLRWGGVAAACVLVIGWLDYFTGREISFATFYLLPVALAAYKGGRDCGLLISLASADAWYLAETSAGARFSQPWIPLWNVASRLAVFIIVTLIVARLRRLNRNLEDKTDSLAIEMTEHRRTEEMLRRERGLFEILTENVTDLIVIHDLEGGQSYLNRSVEAIVGPRGAAAIGGWMGRIAPEDRPRVRQWLQAAVVTGREQRGDYQIIRSDGSRIDIESRWNVARAADGKPANVVEVAREVTERKQAERIHAGEKEVLEMIAAGRPLPAVLDTLARRIESWSGARCVLLVCESGGAGLVAQGAPGFPDALVRSVEAVQVRGHREFLEGTRGVPRLPVVTDVRSDPGWDSCRAAVVAFGLPLCCTHPVSSSAGQLLGLMTTFHPVGARFDGRELGLFEKAGHIAAIAIERQRADESLSRLSNLILTAQEAERRRVARELHDSVNQMLSSIGFRIQAIDARIASDDPALKEEVRKVRLVLDRAALEVRRISNNLRPSELDELGLESALRSLCDEVRERTGLEVELRGAALPARLPAEMEMALYRIVQEALHNVVKHARATRVELCLEVGEGRLRLAVRDNGTGLNAGAAKPSRTGMGLLSMRERVTALGGTFRVASVPGAGTGIELEIPLPRRFHEAEL